MKKLLLSLSLAAFLMACGSESSSSENTAANEASSASADIDSTNAAEMSAATRQSEVDTTRMNVGTDRTEGGAALADAEKGAKLISLSDCTACHQVDKKLVGPAYTAVAQKYEANEKSIAYLAGKIIEGGKGVWGDMAMTAHPNVTQQEARQMAEYVLSLKK